MNNFDMELISYFLSRMINHMVSGVVYNNLPLIVSKYLFKKLDIYPPLMN